MDVDFDLAQAELMQQLMNEELDKQEAERL